MSERLLRVGCAVVLVALLAGGAASARAEEAESPPVRAEPTPEQEIYDAAVLRPLSFVTLVASAVIYPVAYAVSLATGGTALVQEVCWDAPFERTFERPLGEL